jgi:hypothetical protein
MPKVSAADDGYSSQRPHRSELATKPVRGLRGSSVDDRATRVLTARGWLHIVALIDANRQLVDGRNLYAELVPSSLSMAPRSSPSTVRRHVHSDRGAQVASAAYRARVS